MKEKINFKGKQYGVKTIVKYRNTQGFERIGTILKFESGILGDEIIIAKTVDDYRKYNYDSIEIKEFESFAIVDVIGVDNTIDLSNLDRREPENTITPTSETLNPNNQGKQQKKTKEMNLTWLGIFIQIFSVGLGIVVAIAFISSGNAVLGVISLAAFTVFGMCIGDLLIDDETKERATEINKAKEHQRLHEGYKCPNCGQHAGHPIGSVSKGVSIGFWGLASDKIGKTYECYNCKYMW